LGKKIWHQEIPTPRLWGAVLSGEFQDASMQVVCAHDNSCPPDSLALHNFYGISFIGGMAAKKFCAGRGSKWKLQSLEAVLRHDMWTYTLTRKWCSSFEAGQRLGRAILHTTDIKNIIWPISNWIRDSLFLMIEIIQIFITDGLPKVESQPSFMSFQCVLKRMDSNITEPVLPFAREIF
jgi:hypothetical protein